MPSRLAPLALLIALALPLPAQNGLTPEQRRLNIDSFEVVWQTVRDKHWDPTLGGLNWQAIHDELRPKVEKAATMTEARAVMNDMLDRLKQTHFGIVPLETYEEMGTSSNGDSGARDGSTGIDVRALEDRPLVTSVEPGSPAATAGVKPGWVILRIDGKDLAPALAKIRDSLAAQPTLLGLVQAHTIANRLSGPIGGSVRVDFLDGHDHPVSLNLTRARARGQLAVLGNLPPMSFWVESRTIQPNIGYLRFNLFFEPESLIANVQQAVHSCGKCGGFVVDLRGNPGGIGGLATGLAGWFIGKDQQVLGSMFLRGGTIKFTVFPRSDAFLGPLAVLVDDCSASTSEIFAGGMQDLGRARIFGGRTAGAALPSVFTRLPNGDGFQYAIANYISQGGRTLEGHGVIPDQEVTPTRRQLLDGQDPVLAAAVTWIENQAH